MTVHSDDRIYIFVLSGPGWGSTVLYKLLDSSPNVSTFIEPPAIHRQMGRTDFWTGEGASLFHEYNGAAPGLQAEYAPVAWDPSYIPDMNKVQEVWDKHWDETKHIHCEKSPPTICRAAAYEDHFKNNGKVYFICLMRHPYFCRDKVGRWAELAEYQKKNLEMLENTLLITYEELCDRTSETIKKIIDFVPEIESLETGRSSPLWMGRRGHPLKNYNVMGEGRATPQKINEVNQFFSVGMHSPLLDFFGLSLAP